MLQNERLKDIPFGTYWPSVIFFTKPIKKAEDLIIGRKSSENQKIHNINMLYLIYLNLVI